MDAHRALYVIVHVQRAHREHTESTQRAHIHVMLLMVRAPCLVISIAYAHMHAHRALHEYTESTHPCYALDGECSVFSDMHCLWYMHGTRRLTAQA
jgi:hypothetical protein